MYSEDALVRKIRRRFSAAGAEVGIGDDAAVVDSPDGFRAVLCSDLLVENTHFERRTHPSDAVGFKSIAANVSDIGAMGAVPARCLISVAVPADLDESWIDGFLDGAAEACRVFEVAVVGGDSSSSERIFVDVAMMGHVEPGRAVRRNGARVGDGIYVTGCLGAAALGLTRLESGSRTDPAIRRQLYPEPRHRLGRRIAPRATAMIDVSDGLSIDLGHIVTESGVSARIERESIPCHPGAGIEMALHGGEDYELLVTAADLPSEVDGVSVARIGEIIAGDSNRIVLVGESDEVILEPLGWRHFRSGARRASA